MPESQLITESITMFKWLFGGVSSVIGVGFVWLRGIGKSLNDFKVEVAEKYASKEDLKEVKEDIIREMHVGFDHISKLLEREKK